MSKLSSFITYSYNGEELIITVKKTPLFKSKKPDRLSAFAFVKDNRPSIENMVAKEVERRGIAL